MGCLVDRLQTADAGFGTAAVVALGVPALKELGDAAAAAAAGAQTHSQACLRAVA